MGDEPATPDNTGFGDGDLRNVLSPDEIKRRFQTRDREDWAKDQRVRTDRDGNIIKF